MPTLEELESEVWPAPEFDSHLIVTCYQLRKKPIEDFTTEWSAFENLIHR